MSDTQLTYAVFSDPNPMQVSPSTEDDSLATLTIVVSNSTHRLIECQSISFSFLQGTNAKDFFSDSTGIGTNKLTGWSISQTGSLFTATPDTSPAPISQDGLTFVLSGIKVNEQPGTTDMTITEVTGSGVGVTGTQVIPLSKFPLQFEVGQLTNEPPIVDQGDSVTLSWSGTAGATYELQYVDSNDDTITITHPKGEPDQPLPATGTYTIDDLQDNPTTFFLIVTLQVEGQDDTLTAQQECIVPVKPPKPAINSFNIVANPVILGQQLSFTLSWDVVGSFQITADDGEGGQQRTLPIPNDATSYIVFPTQLITNYTLTVSQPSSLKKKEKP